MHYKEGEARSVCGKGDASAPYYAVADLGAVTSKRQWNQLGFG